MTEGGVSIEPMCGTPVVEDDAETFDYKRRTAGSPGGPRARTPACRSWSRSAEGGGPEP